ncbi:MAG: hypothetical protein HQ494_00075 [Rhodospirillales bacterium]|nr:hypothetical protein [Rhodospirillales bacterium]
MFDKGIYIEFSQIPTTNPPPGGRDDYLHTYIVYRDGRGRAWAIRGGPSGLDDKNLPRSAAEILKFGPGGKIEVQADFPLNKSKDAYKPGETPEDHQATKLNIGTRDPKQVFDQMARKAEEVHDLNIDYDINAKEGFDSPDQNSNSLTRAVLEDVGIDPKTAIPEDIDRTRIPGFENDLKEAQVEARRERNRPNPIEGEIGGTEDQKPTPAPQSGDNEPSGQDDDTSDDNPSGKDQSGDPSNDGQKQSSLLPDPGAASKNETMEITPEQRKLMDDISKSDGPLDEILAKDPRDWTEGEFLEIKKEVINLPSRPEQERLDGMATNFLEDKYGTDPVKYDATGRMIEPQPVRPINKNPVPAKTADGEALRGALSRIGKTVAGAAGAQGSVTAVQGLQSGLNVLKQVMDRDANPSLYRTPGIAPDLKTDGVAGPKTRRALRFAAGNLGRPKIEEGFALGRLNRFARDVQTGRDDSRNLGTTMNKAFGPLFRPAGMALAKQAKPENRAFQATLNDLGPKVFEGGAFKPIKEDGLIGPKTESAFGASLPATGPDRFTSRLGHNMGFFDYDDFG